MSSGSVFGSIGGIGDAQWTTPSIPCKAASNAPGVVKSGTTTKVSLPESMWDLKVVWKGFALPAERMTARTEKPLESKLERTAAPIKPDPPVKRMFAGEVTADMFDSSVSWDDSLFLVDSSRVSP